MNFKLRRLIYKIPGLHSLSIAIQTIQNNRYFDKINKKNVESNRLKALKNSASRKRCFIVGNGPSLTMNDLDLIKDEDCFASNLIFKVFDKTQWRPKYYFIQDIYANVENGLDTLPQTTKKFYGDAFLRVHKDMKTKEVFCYKTKRCYKKVKFSFDISKEVFTHYTITYTMIQAAVYFGYKEIILLGIDHNYALTVDSRGKVIENKGVINHVFTDKNPREVVANLEGMNAAYLKARDVLAIKDISIFNSTRGGKLEWFPRMLLEDVLKNES